MTPLGGSVADNSFFLEEDSTLKDMVNNNSPEPTYATALDRDMEGDFGLSFNTAIGLAFDEDMSFSPFLNNEDRANRDSLIHDKILSDQEAIPDHVVNYYGPDMDGLAVYLRDNLGMSDIKTDEELLADKKEMLSQRRGYAEEVWQTQGTAGKIGQFMGNMNAMMLDPMYLPGYFLGVSQGARGLQLLSSAAKVGLAEGGMETLKQTFVTMPYKQDLGIDYGWEEAGKEIVMAAVGSATLDVGLHQVTKGINGLVRNAKKAGRSTYTSVTQDLNVMDIVDEWNMGPVRPDETAKQRIVGTDDIERPLSLEKPGGPQPDPEIDVKETTMDSPENHAKWDQELEGTDHPPALKEVQDLSDEFEAVNKNLIENDCKLPGGQ